MRPVKMLRKGDTIGLIAPSGSTHADGQVEQAVKAVEKLGLCVVVAPGCYEKRGFLAGTDETKLRDLHTFFADPSIHGIFCIRGGDGASRLLDRLDTNIVSRNPKVFLGYSDITALHLVFNQKTDFVTFHGPMPATEFIRPDFEDYAQSQLLRAIMAPEPLGDIVQPLDAPSVETLSPGTVEGELVGGNLTLICALLGTPFEIDTRGKILLIEDIDEANYRVDRMLTQLRLAGKLEEAAGIAIGDFVNTEPLDSWKHFPIDEVFQDILLPLKKPILKNLPFGHGRNKATLPLGALARVDGPRSRLIVLEPGVTDS
ncbi:LD-carboxypeptidase [candidate division KSB3 bacterium]|uniref:LD-carboxypeptidase n=1 Tax=candidate division KSB3 bacterium TaxID=2044937 RepID=A0A2G6K8X4_9BACT|nr:MAG: LD-carboxypeptidase [candidate division KSB3 bacterium]